MTKQEYTKEVENILIHNEPVAPHFETASLTTAYREGRLKSIKITTEVLLALLDTYLDGIEKEAYKKGWADSAVESLRQIVQDQRIKAKRGK